MDHPALEKDTEWHRIADQPFDRDLELAVIVSALSMALCVLGV
jgi:hypothetical protein